MSTPHERLTPPELVALTPGTLSRTAEFATLERALGRACDAGLRGLVVREPRLEDGPYAELFGRLTRIARDADGWIAVHDRVHLASALEADGVHLAGSSLAPASARELVGDGVALGFSSHAGDAPSRWEGADWLFHSPIRATASKPDDPPLGFDALARFCASTPLPVYALGGMQPGDLARARDHGARGVAVLSGVLGADEPAEAVRRYLAP